jgi:hypothetical protein
VPSIGQLIKIGKDKIAGLGESALLSNEMIACLHNKNITVLANASTGPNPFTMMESWLDGTVLGMTDSQKAEWDFFCSH